jgi:nitroimidazol reductase NimA-like FMN-containing flavoprotein (pyridoxamine 5'-phosphate oxidase superfamily)
MPDSAAIRDIFKRNLFCVIATASPSGAPWLSPVFYNYDSEYNLVWESARDALHSHNIAANPRVAVFIKDTVAKGPARDVYIEATAREVPAERVAEALRTWQDGPHGHSDREPREVGDYGGSRPMRLYEARIERLYVLDEAVGEGYRVDVRVEVDVAELRAGPT